MAELYLIRHGKTYGNTLGRYIGTTDEELCEEGREALKRLKAGRDFAAARPDVVYASPLKRCVQTAEILFPEIPVKLVPDLRECDFGAFENKNYKELSGNAAYQAWIDSGGTLPFPGGESREAFQERCRKGFTEVLEDIRGRGGQTCVALVVHGGTIMSILSAYPSPEKSGGGENFYRWQVKNGEGFRVRIQETDKGGIRLYEISHIGPDSGVSA